MVVILVTRQWTEFRASLNRRTFGIYSIAAVLIAVNWLTYVWAVNAELYCRRPASVILSIPCSAFCWASSSCAKNFVPHNGFRSDLPPRA